MWLDKLLKQTKTFLLYKIIPRARSNLATGRFWPAGRMFDTSALNLNQNCKSEHKGLETFEERKKVVPWQVQPLGCYQNEKRQGESRIENHLHSRHRRIRYTTTTLLLKWQSQYSASSIIRPCWATFFQNLGRISIWPDKKNIYRRVPTVHHLHHT